MTELSGLAESASSSVLRAMAMKAELGLDDSDEELSDGSDAEGVDSMFNDTWGQPSMSQSPSGGGGKDKNGSDGMMSKAEADAMQKQFEALKKTVESMETQLVDQEKKIAVLEGDVVDKDGELVTVREKLERASETAKTQLAFARNQLQTQLAARDGKMASLQTSLNEAQGTIAKLEGLLERAGENGGGDGSEVLAGVKAMYEERLRTAQDSITALQDGEKSYQDSIAALEVRVEELQSAAASPPTAEAPKVVVEQEIDPEKYVARSELEATQAELAAVKKVLEAASAAASTPRASDGSCCKSKDEELQELKAELETVKSGAADAAAAAEAAKPDVNVGDLKKALKKLLKENGELKKTLSESKEAAAAASSASDEAQGGLKEDLEKATNRIAKYKQTQSLAEKALTKLQQALGEKEKELAVAKEEAVLARTSGKEQMEAGLKKVAEEATKLKASHAAMKAEMQGLIGSKEAMMAERAQLVEVIGKMKVGLEESAKSTEVWIGKWKKEASARKKLFNTLQELKGNIRVYTRVRPMNSREKELGDQGAVNVGMDEVLQVVQNDRGVKKNFEFDRVFGPKSTQQEVFADTEPLVTSVLDGYNVCMFAYGQTGAGKTHTMQGSKEDPGVNVRAISTLFKVIDERRADGWSYTVSVSVLEIYNETIRDLLAPVGQEDGGSVRGLAVKQGPGGLMMADGAVWEGVNNVAETDAVASRGLAARSVGATDMNAHSSRSHHVMQVRVEGTHDASGAGSIAKMTLVDLAGSERVGKSGATAERLKEAQAINKSLSALGDVIKALTSKAAHVPFRNSKLTYLLADSLGGASKTLMFCGVSPAADNVSETLSSLQFAARVRTVELGPAKKNTTSKPSNPAGGGATAAIAGAGGPGRKG